MILFFMDIIALRVKHFPTPVNPTWDGCNLQHYRVPRILCVGQMTQLFTNQVIEPTPCPIRVKQRRTASWRSTRFAHSTELVGRISPVMLRNLFYFNRKFVVVVNLAVFCTWRDVVTVYVQSNILILPLFM